MTETAGGGVRDWEFAVFACGVITHQEIIIY